MIYRAIKKRNGDIYICPAQLENVIENPLTAEQQLIVELDDRVTELEQELSKLKESQTQKSIIKLCNRVDKAEQENFELKRAISFYYTNRKDSRNDGVPLEEFKKIWPMK